jgi:serine/threonine-protein kinase
VKLLDFGISKLTIGGDEPGIDPALTQTATIMGSPSYMSPEQLKSTKEVDSRADVWSLGAVLYEAITGKPAFRGESLPQVCAMIASEDPPLPSSRRDGIPLELERSLLRCLEKDPDKRASLVELARTVARYAPDRAHGSLERIEAMAGGAAPRPRSATRAEKSLPIIALTGERLRTKSSWERDKRGKRGRGGLVMLLVVASAVAAIGIYSGRIEVKRLRGDLEGATSAMSSAAGAVSSAVSSVGTEVASAMPPFPALPDEPAASASGAGAPAGSASASAEDSDSEGTDEPPAGSASAAANIEAAPAAKPAQARPHAKPAHHTKKKHHYS